MKPITSNKRIFNTTVDIIDTATNQQVSPSGGISKGNDVIHSDVPARIVKNKPTTDESVGESTPTKKTTHLCMMPTGYTAEVSNEILDKTTGLVYIVEDDEYEPGGTHGHHTELFLNRVKGV